MRRRGMIVILSSPSGAGKTTLTRMLLQDKALDLTLSISVTTRPRRSSEVDGVHYHFIGRRQFDLMKAAGDLLESAEVHGNCYGTPREPVMRRSPKGATCCSTSTGRARSRCARRWERRRQRLHPAAVDDGTARPARPPRRGFGGDDREAAGERQARDRRWRQYDYVVVNDDLQQAYAPCRRSSPPNARAARAWPKGSRRSSRSCLAG